MSKKPPDRILLEAYTVGCWDLLHVGHVIFLERAKRMCGSLLVGVAGDLVVDEDKGEPPIIMEADRMIMLTALRCVDSVLIYKQLGFIEELENLSPALFIVSQTFGCKQHHIDALGYCSLHGIAVRRIPYSQSVSTSKIIEDCRSLR